MRFRRGRSRPRLEHHRGQPQRREGPRHRPPLRADAGHDPDLLWAVRGGGGSVGVVTALQMRLYPVRELYAGALFFPIGRAAEVLHAWRAWTGTVPDQVTSLGRLLRLPPLPAVPGQLAGRAWTVVEAAVLGGAAAGAALTGPRRDGVRG
jgi:hypothetical protein